MSMLSNFIMLLINAHPHLMKEGEGVSAKCCKWYFKKCCHYCLTVLYDFVLMFVKKQSGVGES